MRTKPQENDLINKFCIIRSTILITKSPKVNKVNKGKINKICPYVYFTLKINEFSIQNDYIFTNGVLKCKSEQWKQKRDLLLSFRVPRVKYWQHFYYLLPDCVFVSFAQPFVTINFKR